MEKKVCALTAFCALVLLCTNVQAFGGYNTRPYDPGKSYGSGSDRSPGDDLNGGNVAPRDNDVPRGYFGQPGDGSQGNDLDRMNPDSDTYLPPGFERHNSNGDQLNRKIPPDIDKSAGADTVQ